MTRSLSLKAHRARRNWVPDSRQYLIGFEWRGDRPWRNRLRAFAASVLIHVCEPVTYDKLSSYIWDEPPSSAPANLRTYATALRRKLAVAERGADRWLRTTSGTYQLIIDPKNMDVTIFNRLVAESDRHFRDGDVSQGVEKLDLALRLWRGRPMQNVRDSWLLSADRSSAPVGYGQWLAVIRLRRHYARW